MADPHESLHCRIHAPLKPSFDSCCIEIDDVSGFYDDYRMLRAHPESHDGLGKMRNNDGEWVTSTFHSSALSAYPYVSSPIQLRA